MTHTEQQRVAEIAGLTRDEQLALIPFTTFSDMVGRRLISLGYLQCNDGVWTHTKAGASLIPSVRAHLQEQANPTQPSSEPRS